MNLFYINSLQNNKILQLIDKRIIQMETEEVKLQDIQAGNEAARKKLQGFRSGLQRLMNKKSKKLSQHQPPSHDTKSPINTKQQNYFSRNSANSELSNFNSVPPGSAGQFGFNSTLFKQIADDTVMISNPSGMHKQDTSSKFAYNSYNSVFHTEYISSSSKPSNYYYQQKGQPISGNESFSKASKLFSQVQDIINKSKKTAKLPVKPIQKYFDRIEQNLSESKVEDQELNLSKSGNKIDDGVKLSPRKEVNVSSAKIGKNEEIKSEQKTRNVSAKDELKNASSFLKSYKGKTDLTKAPPLPPSFPKENNRNLTQQQTKNSAKKNVSRQSLEQFQFSHMPIIKSPSKMPSGQNSVQIHKSKLKQALNQRKKIMKDDNILDDSVQLEFSDEQTQHQNNQQKNIQLQDTAKNKEYIKKLQAEKEQLLKELELIQQELDRLQNCQ